MADKEPTEKPDEAAQRVINLLAATGDGTPQQEVVGYKVVALWSDVPGQDTSTPHKVGETLKVGDVDVPKGLDREKYISSLVEIGLLAPQYAKSVPAEETKVAAAQSQASTSTAVQTQDQGAEGAK